MAFDAHLEKQDLQGERQRIVCRESLRSYSSIFGERKGPDDYSEKPGPVGMRVNPHICAILAGFVSVAATAPKLPAVPPGGQPGQEQGDGGTVAVPVMFRLRDGVRITGALTSWNGDGFDGTFGRRRWLELRPDDAWRIFRRVIDEQSAKDWIALGRMALLHEGLERRAESAFAAALSLDDNAAELIDNVRREVVAIREAARAQADAAAGFARATESPEAADWPTDPWPDLPPEGIEAARLALFTDAEAVLTKAGLTIEPVESEFFIVYTDASRAEAAKWAVQVLDHWYREVLKTVGLAENVNLFWGKAVVFIFEEQDQFRLIEAGTFNQLVPMEQVSITHYQGPKVFINAWRARDTVELEAALVRAMVRGVLHRFHSPARLPAWANEGLPEYFAQRRIDESTYAEGNRPQALRLVRTGYPVPRVLEMEYRDHTWPGPEREGEALGALLVEFLIKTNRQAFVEWMKAAKAGFDWRDGLEQHFGGSIASFLDRFVKFYSVND